MATLQPIQLIVLQGTAFCNLNCTYCDLSADSRRTKGRMSADIIDLIFSQLFAGQRLAPEVTVVWHSGEPLTLPPDYYDATIAQILRLRGEHNREDIAVRFDFQTNGVLINKAWCEFFNRHADVVDLGVSCDGPEDLHDRYRRNWSNRASHAETVRGMNLLQEYSIKYNIIAVVTRPTLSAVERFYDFFFSRRDHISGFHFNILADSGSQVADLGYSDVDRAPYYKFFRALLSLSQSSQDAGEVFKIRNFSHGFSRIAASQSGDAPDYLREASAPLRCLNVEVNGVVSTFYAGLTAEVLPDLYGDGRGLSLGNIQTTTIEEMVQSAKLTAMMADFQASAVACRTSCEYAAVCTGGFEITKRLAHGRFDSGETVECSIHIKALTDALLDDIEDHLNGSGLLLAEAQPA